jgi:hypothetical protein
LIATSLNCGAAAAAKKLYSRESLNNSFDFSSSGHRNELTEEKKTENH